MRAALESNHYVPPGAEVVEGASPGTTVESAVPPSLAQLCFFCDFSKPRFKFTFKEAN